MADLELDTETTEEQEIETPVTETTSDETQDDEITYEKALEWKEKAERLEKAEARIEKLKSQQKLQKKEQSQTGLTEDKIQSLLKREKFFDKNPDAEPYRKEIEKLELKGLSIEDAYYLASKEDREVDKNREVYGKSMIGSNGNDTGLSPISVKEFDSMTQSSQDAYIEKMTQKHGKVMFK